MGVRGEEKNSDNIVAEVYDKRLNGELLETGGGTAEWQNGYQNLRNVNYFLNYYKVPEAEETKDVLSLKGEAYFKVKTKPDSPFHIMVDKLNVQVTGTSFNVKAYEESDKIDITLVEGSVNIRRGQEVLATLIPGHKFIYCKTTDEYSIPKPI